MEKRVLFILREYCPKPAPTGVCVQNVQKGLLNLGIRSDILQFGEGNGCIGENEFGKIYSINSLKLDFDTTNRNTISFYLKKIPLIFKWPIYSYKAIRNCKDYLVKMALKENYDAIIGVSLPVETVFAASNSNKFIFYELDSITNNPEYKRGVKKLYRRRLLRIERALYDKAKLIIHLESNREYYEKKAEYDKYTKKTVYADVPNLVEQTCIESADNIESRNASEPKVTIAYFGSLFPDYRSPEYIISVLKKASESVDLQCTFYSRGACEDIIEQNEKDNPQVFSKGGYVEHEKVKRIIQRTDFLLSIGNMLTGDDYSLPSKVIEYIGSGKPIIHVRGGDNDSAVKYLDKYGLACIIDPTCDFEYNVRSLVCFLKSKKGMSRCFQEVREVFENNDPLYTAKIVERFIINNEHKAFTIIDN